MSVVEPGDGDDVDDCPDDGRDGDFSHLLDESDVDPVEHYGGEGDDEAGELQ